jgi:SAM-dependent methyltransferase
VPSGIRPEQDAYGQLLLAALEGRPAQEIMERDDGLIFAGEPSEYFLPYGKWPTYEKKAMRFVRGRVLDVGCGAGRAALELQGRGLDVVAIDEAPLAVEVAHRRGVRDARALALLDVDESLGAFDTILILRNNFGLAGTEDAARRLLRRLHRLTTEQGRIVTDSVHPDRIDEADMQDSAQHRFRVRFRNFASPWFRYEMFTPEDFDRLVDGTGWRVARVLDEGTPRYGIVLEKS